MSLFVVDVEADGPYSGDYSMISFGIVKVQADLTTAPRLFGQMSPISDRWIDEAIAVSGITRTEHLSYEKPEIVMPRLTSFLAEHSRNRPIFISDNPAFDWQFINMYLHRYTGDNPFGFSARRIGDFYAGLVRNFSSATRWKRYRRTIHDHNPVNDALGNAEALLHMAKEYGISLSL